MVKRYTVPDMAARHCPFQGAQPCSRTPDPFRCSPQRMAGTAPPRLGAGKIHVRLAQFPCDLLSYRVKCLRTVAVKCGECWASAHRPQTAACRPRSDAVPAPIPPVTIMYARVAVGLGSAGSVVCDIISRALPQCPVSVVSTDGCKPVHPAPGGLVRVAAILILAGTGKCFKCAAAAHTCSLTGV